MMFQQKKLDAATTLNVGEYPLNKKLDLNQSAALMKVISMIYNLEEAIIKTKNQNYFYKSNAAYYKNQCDKIEDKIKKLEVDMTLAEKDDNRIRLDQYEAEIELLKKDLKLKSDFVV